MTNKPAPHQQPKKCLKQMMQAVKSMEEDEPVLRSDKRGVTKEKSKSNYEEEWLK